MKLAATLAALALAVGAALFLLFTDASSVLDEAPERSAPEAPEIQERSVPEVASAPDQGAAETRLAVEEAPPEEPAATEPVADPDEDPRTSHIVGTLRLPSGAPAAAAQLSVRGWGGNSQRIAKYGKPDDWKNLEGEADSEGRFDLAFVPPRAFQFVLEAAMEGHASLSWRWGEIEQGSTVDVGTLTFDPACVIRGRVVDGKGGSTGINWRVYADESGTRGIGGRTGTSVSVPVNAATGDFELVGMPPGMVELKAYSRSANWIDGPTIEVEPGSVATAEIVFDGPDLSSTITVRTFCRGYSGFTNPMEGRIVARDAGGQEFVAKKIEGSSQSWAIEELPDGVYDLEVTSAVHETWTKTGVRPGEAVDARLRGSAALALTVVDGGTGQPLTDYRLRLRYENARWFPNVYTIRDRGRALPPGGLFEGVIPWDITALVDAEGYAVTEHPLGQVKAGTTASAEVGLLRGGTVELRVVNADGTPAARAKVVVHPFHEGYVPGDVFSGPRDQASMNAFRAGTLDESADENGAVTMSAMATGEYGAYAEVGGVTTEDVKFALSEGSRETVELRLPARGALHGTLTGLESGELETLRIKVQPAGQRLPHGRIRDLTPLDGTGDFRVEGLAVGEHEVRLLRVPGQGGRHSMGTMQGVVLGNVTIEPGPPTVRTFDGASLTPGTLKVRVSVNGQSADGHVVHVQGTGGQGSMRATTDDGGHATCEGLFPGEYRVSVNPTDGRWQFFAPMPTTVVAKTESLATVDIETIKGRIRLVAKDTGAPLAELSVNVNSTVCTTDSDGWLELEAPEGRVTLMASSPEGKHWFDQVAWGPAGPAKTVIEVDR